jgi:hypothetical protein
MIAHGQSKWWHGTAESSAGPSKAAPALAGELWEEEAAMKAAEGIAERVADGDFD